MEAQLVSPANIGNFPDEPYHLRAAYDRENRIIRLLVLDGEEPKTLIIRGVQTLLGHPKTDGCCDDPPR